jgi:two-component system, NtrC family, response regulator HydG
MKQRVLIVDDDVDHAESLADVLELRGHPVELAHSGEDGIEAFRAGEFDLVLLDVKLPGINGVETFLELKKLRPSARVMMMTGFSLEQLIAQAIENGALGVLYKPFAATELLATLGQVTPRGRVLVADDDPDFVESITPILAAADFDLSLAANGRDAVAEIDKRMPDCLILDLGLAVLAGPDGMARLLDVCKSIPTILVTGGYSDEVAESVAGFGLRAHGLLQKPFDPSALLAAVGAAVVPAAS